MKKTAEEKRAERKLRKATATDRALAIEPQPNTAQALMPLFDNHALRGPLAKRVKPTTSAKTGLQRWAVLPRVHKDKNSGEMLECLKALVPSTYTGQELFTFEKETEHLFLEEMLGIMQAMRASGNYGGRRITRSKSGRVTNFSVRSHAPVVVIKPTLAESVKTLIDERGGTMTAEQKAWVESLKSAPKTK